MKTIEIKQITLNYVDIQDAIVMLLRQKGLRQDNEMVKFQNLDTTLELVVTVGEEV